MSEFCSHVFFSASKTFTHKDNYEPDVVKFAVFTSYKGLYLKQWIYSEFAREAKEMVVTSGIGLFYSQETQNVVTEN